MPQPLAQRSFLLLLAGITVLYAMMMMPLLTAIVWSMLIAILFNPLKLRLQPYFAHHDNWLALFLLLICVFVVMLPLAGVLTALTREAIAFYDKIRAGHVDLIGYVGKGVHVPPVVEDWLSRFGLTTEELNRSIKSLASQSGSFIAGKVLSVGQNTAQFVFTFAVLLYLAFFFLRDGDKLVKQLILALPLGDRREQLLMRRISDVINAVVRGGLMVATVQGTLGGLIFWVLGIKTPLLWGVVMIVASLIPAVGSSLIWAPVALYLLLNGFVWKGVILISFGVLVISMIDNILRPILVGRDTGIPDYVILVSTLGGIFMFGVNGFVLGPLVVALFISVWEIFIREFHPE